MSDLASNVTNPGLFQIRFQYILALQVSYNIDQHLTNPVSDLLYIQVHVVADLELFNFVSLLLR